MWVIFCSTMYCSQFCINPRVRVRSAAPWYRGLNIPLLHDKKLSRHLSMIFSSQATSHVIYPRTRTKIVNIGVLSIKPRAMAGSLLLKQVPSITRAPNYQFLEHWIPHIKLTQKYIFLWECKTDLHETCRKVYEKQFKWWHIIWKFFRWKCEELPHLTQHNSSTEFWLSIELQLPWNCE